MLVKLCWYEIWDVRAWLKFAKTDTIYKPMYGIQKIMMVKGYCHDHKASDILPPPPLTSLIFYPCTWIYINFYLCAVFKEARNVLFWQNLQIQITTVISWCLWDILATEELSHPDVLHFFVYLTCVCFPQTPTFFFLF